MMTAEEWRAQQRRRVAGARAVDAGKAFEKKIRSEIEIAKHAGLVAWYQHAEPAFRLIWKRGRDGRPTREFMPCAAGFADYSGILCGGLAFAVEVKATKDPRFARSKISPAQQAHLDATAAAGGLALLALQLRDHDAGTVLELVMPWREVPWVVKRSAETLGADDPTITHWRIDNTPRPGALGRFLWRCSRCGRAAAVSMCSHSCCAPLGPLQEKA